ncbi:hypothetical protein LTR82_018132 [Friedmanniomyces endolithicus]|uniref:GDP/GTP exchange factor Sec2 N-terminal domain-containing protein n=1 Tax=Friedmanniomyces endolithicus TaxID=329885 RepID=A0AAN6F4E8_9PEZI|nr:hypothetical protein LTR82_018132 [Friedmanniomyces endolithicus]
MEQDDSPQGAHDAALSMGSAAGDAVKVKELEDEVKFLAEKANNAFISHATMLQRQQQRRNGAGESNGDIAQVVAAIDKPLEKPTLSRFGSLMHSRKASPVSNAIPQTSSSREKELESELVKERTQRIAAEKKVKTLEAEVEELSATLFQEANEMVSSARQETAALQRKLELMEQRAAEQRPAGDLDTLHKENARLRERFKILEQRDSDRRCPSLQLYLGRVSRSCCFDYYVKTNRSETCLARCAEALK